MQQINFIELQEKDLNSWKSYNSFDEIELIKLELFTPKLSKIVNCCSISSDPKPKILRDSKGRFKKGCIPWIKGLTK